jgi:hypothetical protein
MHSDRLFNDDPVDGSDDLPDLLGRSEYADELAAVLDRVSRHESSSVLALIGSWGSGKSSLIAMTRKSLIERQDSREWLIAEYNPWSYTDVDMLISGFFAEIREALPREGRWSDTRDKIREFGRSVKPFAGLIPGLNGEAVEATAEKIAGDASMAKKRDAVADALKTLDRPILVILDDLDRLEPQELLLVFKLVRLVGRLPNLYYLLSYDEQTLLDVLMRTDLVSDQISRARDYLEKIVQVRLDLPAFRQKQKGELVDSMLDAILIRNEKTLTEEEQYLLGRAYYDHLEQRMATPRAVNRFMAQVDVFYATAREEVSFFDFLIITFLRTFESGVYAMLQRHKDELLGNNLRASLSGTTPKSPAQRLAVWEERLEEAGVARDNISGVMSLLGALFIPIQSAHNNMILGGGDFAELSQRRGVGHVDYFDRYFTFGVPDEDIADQAVIAALNQLESENQGTELQLLVERLVTDTGRVVRKLHSLKERGELPSAKVLRLLADRYDDLPADHRLFEDPRRMFNYLAMDLFRDLDAAQGLSVIRAMSFKDSGLLFTAIVITRFPVNTGDGEVSQGDQQELAWLPQAHDAMRTLIADRLADYGKPLDGDSLEILFSLHAAWRVLDPDQARAWLLKQVELGEVSLQDVIGSLINVSYGGSIKPRRRMDSLDLASVDNALGVDFVLDRLKSEIDKADLTATRYAGLEPTLEKRRVFAMAELYRIRAARQPKLTD